MAFILVIVAIIVAVILAVGNIKGPAELGGVLPVAGHGVSVEDGGVGGDASGHKGTLGSDALLGTVLHDTSEQYSTLNCTTQHYMTLHDTTPHSTSLHH